MVKIAYCNVKASLHAICIALVLSSTTQAIHNKVVEDLIQHVQSIHNRLLTQTEAHIRVPEIQQKLQDISYDLTPYRSLIFAVLKNGARFVNTHYEFFHAQHGRWQIFQDTFKKLYQKLVNSAVKEQDFYFFRFAYNNQFFSRYRTIKEFLTEQLERFGIVDDMIPENSKRLLSANFSLFANMDHKGESSWQYFVEGKSWFLPGRSVMEEIMEMFGCTKKYIDELLNLSSTIVTKEGRLFQIFIPKTVVDEIVYTAWVRGMPYDAELIKTIVALREDYPRPKIKEIVHRITEDWQHKNSFGVAITQNLIKGVQEGRYDPSTFLETYRQNPLLVPYFDSRQARILIEPSHMLNPTSDIHIIRYSMLTPLQLDQYERELDLIIEKIVEEKKQRE